MKPTIYLGADHAGFDLKTSIYEHLEARGFHVEDLGAHELNPTDDYPQYGEAVAEAVSNHPGSLGVLSCGNAEGISIVANKFDGIRAGVGYSIEAATTMRADDDANVISIPGRLDIPDDPLQILDAFLKTEFSEAPRHVRRLEQVSEIEARQTKELIISPSVLANDENEFKEKLMDEKMRSLAILWHIDILNGSMYDSTSFADPVIAASLSSLPEIELHLMIQNPLPIITNWKQHVPHLKRVIMQVEIDQNVETLLKAVQSMELKAGLAINPETKIDEILKYEGLFDTLLIMSVHPGKSGQEFLGEKILHKIYTAKEKLPGVTIAVDGGINLENAQKVALSGADQIISASALWKSKDLSGDFQKFKNVLLS